jgi:signal transduction histidine kinase
MKSPLVLASAVELLGHVFPGLSGQDYADLVDHGELCDYPAETLLCVQGNHEEVFYIVLSGLVEAYQNLNATDKRVLKRMGPHEFFGEIALVHNAPRAANVRTLEPTTVLEIYRQPFETVLFRSPAMALTVVREVTRRLRSNDEGTITELRRKNAELEAAYHQLAEQQRARSEFLTTVSHELRTPLTSASGYLQFIRTGTVSGPPLDHMLDTVSNNLQVITALVNDILFVQEMDEIVPAFEPVEIGGLLCELVNSYTAHAADNLNLVLDISPELPAIQGNSQNLSRAFNAIIDNAIKFSPNGGDIRITAIKEGMVLHVTITDSGIGISNEHLPKIFERFYHVDEIDGYRFGGVGLGLPIARHIIERHGGKIEVASTDVVRCGTIVIIHLPVS